MLTPAPFFILLVCLVFNSLNVQASEQNEWQQWQSEASSAYQAGNYDDAEAAIRKAIARAEKADNGDIYKASSLNLLAFIQEAKGQPEQAMASLSTAVTLAKKASASPDEQLATLLFNQGVLLQKNHQLNKADGVLAESIEQFQLSQSDGGGKLWQAILLKTQILISLGDQQQTLKLVSTTLSDSMDKKGAQIPLSVESDLVLSAANIQLNEGQYYQAITSLEQMKKKLNGESKLAAERLPELLHLLAMAYDKSGQTDKAASTRKQSLNAQNDGPASMATVMQLNELGLYQQQQNHLEQATQYYQQALSQLKLLDKEHSIEQATILGNLGALQLATHDTKAAEASLSQSLAIYQSLQKRPVEAAGIAGYLGTLYYNKRQFSMAETAFLTAIQNLQKAAPKTDESLLLALQNIQSLYIAWDKPAKAAQYNQAIQEIKQQLQ